MKGPWKILLTIALTLVPAQVKGSNSGILVRVSQQGLSYAAQKTVDYLYDKYKHEKIDDVIEDGEDERINYNLTNLKIDTLDAPAFNLNINQGRGVSPALKMGYLKASGTFSFTYKIWFLSFTKNGTFSATARQTDVNTKFDVGMDRTGRPTAALNSCSGSLGSFDVNVDTDGLVGWILRYFDGTVNRYLHRKLEPMICKQISRYVTKKLNPELQTMNVTKKWQTSGLLLDYSLVQPPTFGANFIDTNIKGDLSWKGRRSRSAALTSIKRDWPVIPGSDKKMATIYMTDHIMNSLGDFFHNDKKLTYNVTREESSLDDFHILMLSCPDTGACLGAMFPDLSSRYPDGWFEFDLRTVSPPRLMIGRSEVIGKIHGAADIFVKMPNGDRTKVGSATAHLRIPFTLKMKGGNLTAHLEKPIIRVTPTHFVTPEIEKILKDLSSGFASHQLEGFAGKGIPLPSFKDIGLVNSHIQVKDGVIAISTDVDYSGTVNDIIP